MKKVFVLVIGFAGGILCGFLLSDTPKAVNIPSKQSERATQVRSQDFGGADVLSDLTTALDARSWEHSMFIYELIESAELSRLEELAGLLTQQTDAPLAFQALDAVLLKWSELDRMAAIQFAESYAADHASVLPLKQLMMDWARVDPTAAWAYAVNSKSKKSNQAFVIHVIAETDSVSALKLLQELEGNLSSEQPGLVESVFRSLAEDNLQRAQSEVELLDPNEQAEAYASILRSLGSSDPLAGVAYLQSLPKDKQKQWRLQTALVYAWVDHDMAHAAQSLFAMPESELRDQLTMYFMSSAGRRNLDQTLDIALQYQNSSALKSGWRTLMTTVAKQNPERGLELLPSLPKEAREGFLKSWMQVDASDALDWSEANLSALEVSKLFGPWMHNITRNDPSSAMRLIDLMAQGDQRDRALQQSIYSLAYRDPQGTLEWVLTQPDDATRQSSLTSVMRAWAKEDPEAAVAYGFEHFSQNPILLEKVVGSTIGEWAKKSPLEAIEWGNGLSDQKLSNKAVSTALQQWAHEDRDAAATYILGMPQTDARSERIASFVSSTTREDPQEALAWMEQLDPSEQTDRVMRSFISVWTSQDSLATSEWVDSLPEGHRRDVAATELVGQIFQKSPQDAMPWALSIKNEKLRNQALGNIVNGASRVDPSIVKQAIEAMTLSEKQMKWYRERYLKAD